MWSDDELQQHVVDELAWDPSIGADRIGVAVKNGVATLTGRLGSYAQRWRAATAALRICGITGVVNQLTVDLPPTNRPTDEKIAAAAWHALAWNAVVPRNRVRVSVEDGCVTLAGEVEWKYQSLAAEAAIRDMLGVVDLVNLIEVKPTTEPRDVTRQIEAAVRRRVRNGADGVSVIVNGRTVTLCGRLGSWRDRHEARLAAWGAPGVRNVIDQTAITARR